MDFYLEILTWRIKMRLKMNKVWILVFIVLILGIPVSAVKINDSSLALYKPNSNMPIANNMDIILHSNKIYDGKLNATNAEQYNITSKPKNGKLTVDKNGKFTYAPNKNFVGKDSFKYTVRNGKIKSNTAIVTIIVKNKEPISNDIEFNTKVNIPYNGKLNSTDEDKDNITYNIVSNPVNGTLTLNDNGTYTYTPNSRVHGNDSFTYRSNDGISYSNTSTVKISIMNTPPVANDMDITYNPRSPCVGTLKGTDEDNDTLTYTVISQTKYGILVYRTNGYYNYRSLNTPKREDTFTYIVNDKYNDSKIGKVTITINR